MKKIAVQLGLVIIVLLAGFLLYSQNQKSRFDHSLGVDEDHPFLIKYRKEFEDQTILRAAEEDVNDDGKKDLVLIYHSPDDERNYTVVLLHKGEKDYFLSNATPAPRENIEIQFKNIDDKEQTEFIISGSKDGNYGYAIYRLEQDLDIRDLFSEDMDSCC